MSKLINPDLPIYLTRADGHMALANSKALEIAGITADTPNPPGGEILKDEQGKPNGLLVDKAMNLVNKHIPASSPEMQEKYALKANEVALAYGLTTIHDAGSDWETVNLWKRLYADGKMQVRIKGLQVAIHAIGDAANRKVLDLYERALHEVPLEKRQLAAPRHRIEHAQIVHPNDIPRFKKLGVIPSMQASHAIGDLHFAVRRLSLNRLRGAYAWRAFIDAGCVIAGGSDAPVEEGNPLIELNPASRFKLKYQ